MRKKLIVTGITCVLLLVSGICYSCAYTSSSPALISSVSEESADESTDIEATELSRKEEQSISEDGSLSESVQAEEITYIYVHICGAVAKPGVYQVAAGARLVDLIEVSGGLTAEAAGDYINQAQQVNDGQRFYIPAKEELKNLSTTDYQAGDPGNAEDEQKTSLVNINTADTEELMSLPGIGQAKADSIISYRTSNGKFKTIEDLMNIPGIKEGLFGQISTKITAN